MLHVLQLLPCFIVQSNRSTRHPLRSHTMEAEVRPPAKSSIYNALSQYTFSLDPEFQAGLTSLTNDPSLSPEELESTIFQAQCFYFARRYGLPPIDPADYKAWLFQRDAAATQSSANEQHHSTHIAAQPLGQPQSTSQLVSPTIVPSAEASPPEGPPYPASFEAIVDLITRNQPIPGIEEIPDTVLDASLSAPNQTARRKKPWETGEAVKDIEPVLGDAAEIDDGKPTGVVGILQPIKKLGEGEGTNPGALDAGGGKKEQVDISDEAKRTVLGMSPAHE